MPRFHVSLTVVLDTSDESTAADEGWEIAQHIIAMDEPAGIIDARCERVD